MITEQVMHLTNASSMCSCYRTVPNAIWEIFSKFLIFVEIIAKYQKRGKYLPIMHEATCDNYFIVKLNPNAA